MGTTSNSTLRQPGMHDRKIILVYDTQCPACHYYCQLLQIKATVGELVLVNAREPSEIMNEITTSSLDIDQGMVLKMGDALYYGSDAINILSRIGSRSGIFNKLNYWIFRSRTVSNLLYPILRYVRNLLLKLLGKSKINNLAIHGNDKF